MEFKRRTTTNYAELFEQRDTEQSNLTAEGGFGEKWNWYQSIYGLAQGDVTKFDTVTKLNVHTCLMQLSFVKEKNELEKKLIKR